MTIIVADACFCGAWIFPDEATAAADALLDGLVNGTCELRIPALWHYEMANMLRSAVRRGRLDVATALAAEQTLCKVPISRVDSPDSNARTRMLTLANRCNLSAYDAAYLELALRFRVQLYTNDRHLRQAALASGYRCESDSPYIVSPDTALAGRRTC